MREGSKVVCVDDRFPPEVFIYYNCVPIKDKAYTIRGLGVGVSLQGEPGEVVVYLEGMENPCSTKPPHPERGFAQWRFREIEPPKAEAKDEAKELAEERTANV